MEMDSIFKLPFARCSDDPVVQEGIEKCPFLRNINEPTVFSFSSATFPTPVPVRGAQGPIFEDEPNFDVAFRLFHGQNGVVPLAGRAFLFDESQITETSATGPQFDPLAAKAATISLSAFGPGGPFGFDSFSKNKQNKKPSNFKPVSQNGGKKSSHESLSNEWLETGQCPIAKSYRAVSGVIPLVTKFITPLPGLKLKCPQAIVAARAALSRTELVKNLRPQPLPAKILAIALLGMAANIPLGVWREHTAKFSLQWFAAIHAAVPFIAMLRKSVLMPKTAMAFTLAASILGQTIGSRAERIRLKALEAPNANAVTIETVVVKNDGGNELDLGISANGLKMPNNLGNCGNAKIWEVIPGKIEGSTGASMCC